MKGNAGKTCRKMVAVLLSILMITGFLPPISIAGVVPAQSEQASPLTAYNDLPEQAYYLEALEFLTHLGVIQPDEEGAFAHARAVTREEFAVWLASSLGLPPVQASVFTDAPDSSAAAPYIHALYRAGVVNGYVDGSFRGSQPITRAEAVKLLARVTGRPGSPDYASMFTDVRADDWFAGDVGTLANMRVIRGRPDGTFAPFGTLTRGEAVTLLYRLLFEERRIEGLNKAAPC